MDDPLKVFVKYPGKMLLVESPFSVKLQGEDLQIYWSLFCFLSKTVSQLNLILKLFFHLDLGAFRLYWELSNVMKHPFLK